MTAPTIFIRHANLAYDGIPLFQNLNLTLSAGKCTTLLGPSGVGKSSLLRMIANLSSPNTTFSGAITSDNQLSLSSQISYMAQTDLLMPWLTVLDNVLLSVYLQKKNKKNALTFAKDLLEKVGLHQDMNKYPRELSGGMRQRTALVRTFLQEKPVILMDEPFSAVDAITRFQLQNLAAELFKNKTVFLITHDPVEALRLGDEIVILSGQPAVLETFATLDTPSPRDPADPVFIAHQAKLFHALMRAKEISR